MSEVKLDLGCSTFKMKGFIGIDIMQQDGKVDIVHDLNTGIPFGDSTVDAIYTSHFLEHCKNIFFMLDEMWRVCKNGAKIGVIVPLLEWHSIDHHQLFGPGFFHKFIDPEKFDIEHKSITERTGHIPALNNNPESLYYMFEKTFILTVKK